MSGERESSLADPHGGPAATVLYDYVRLEISFKRNCVEILFYKYGFKLCVQYLLISRIKLPTHKINKYISDQAGRCMAIMSILNLSILRLFCISSSDFGFA